MWIYKRAWKTDPGTITKENCEEYIKKFDDFYDDMTFKRKNECVTCKLIKPARSKHCKLCNRCVSVFDHHCPWIRSCVGEKNIHLFTKFIFSHMTFCFLKFLLSFYILMVLISNESKGLFIVNFDNWEIRKYLLLKIFIDNIILVMLFFWTGFTSCALFLFGMSLIGRYG